MSRLQVIVTAAAMMIASASAMAHFPFVVADKSGVQANVFLSEDLDIDKDIKASLVANSKLVVRDSAGKDTAAPLGKEHDHHYELAVPGSGLRVIYGTLEMGVKQRGDSKPYSFTYYPKSVVGDAFDAKATVGEKLPVELVVVGKPGAAKIKFLSGGKPVTKTEINVIYPGTEGVKKLTTDENGETPVITETGRFGAWAKVTEAKSGELNGKKYEEVRSYPTLVADIGVAK